MSAINDQGDQFKITVTFFETFGATTKSEETLTIRDLCDRIEGSHAATKDVLPWLKLARFGSKKTPNGSLRHNDNVLTISGIEADYDGEQVSVDDAIEKLTKANIRAIVYTSPSHTSEKPRWRVLAPFSTPIEPDLRDRMMNRLNGVLGGGLSPESWTLSQSYYLGFVDGNENNHRVEFVDEYGFIDLEDDLDITAITKPNHTRDYTKHGDEADQPSFAFGKTKLDEAAAIKGIVERGEYHRNMFSLLAKWIAKGLDRNAAKKKIIDVLKTVPPERQDRRWGLRATDKHLDPMLDWICQRQDKKAANFAEQAKAKADETGRDSIPFEFGELARATDLAENALITRCAKLYRRGSNLVRPEVVETTGFKGRVTRQAVLRVATVPMVVDMLARVAIFSQSTPRGLKIMNPPEQVAKGLLSRQDSWRFSSVAGVITSPTLRADGSILAATGYDSQTQLFVAAVPPMPNIPNTLTKADAIAAIEELETLIKEFPFADDASKSVAISGILSTVCRGAFPVAPLHAASAPTPGSGKSYLVDVIASIATGNLAPVLTWSRNNEENEKRIDGALLDGSPIIAIDNISTELGGDKICQTVERQFVSVRRLGSSDKFEVENRATIFATGNNLIFKGDITRRALLATLDPGVDRPELRQFVERPTDIVRRDQGRYIAAALKIVAAYIQAGQPDKLPALASFETWSDTVRSAIVWVGRADPVDTMLKVIDDDPEHQARIEFVKAWGSLKTGALTVDEMIALADETVGSDPDKMYLSRDDERRYVNEDFREALFEIAGLRGSIDKDRAAKWLRSHRDRVISGFVLKRVNGRKSKWSLESVK